MASPVPQAIHKITVHLFSLGIASTVLVLSGDVLFPYVVSKHVYLRTLVLLGAAVVCVGIALGRKPNKLYRGLLVSMAVLLGWNLIAALAGVGPGHSFWSGLERMEGVLGMVFWVTLALVAGTLLQSTADWLVLVKWQVGVASAVAAMAVVHSVATLPLANFFYTPDPSRLSAGWGNPGYTGLYAGIHLLWALPLFWAGWSKTFHLKEQLQVAAIWLAASLSLLGLLVLSDSRAAVLGVIGALGLLGSYLLVLHWPILPRLDRSRLPVIGSVFTSGLLLALSCLLFWIAAGDGLVGVELAEKLGERSDTVLIRFKVWAIAQEAWWQRPLLGWGPDHFFRAFALLEPADTAIPKPFDRAHNIYLESLLGSGIPGLLSILTVFALVLWRLFLNLAVSDAQERALAAGFVAVLLCCLLQALVWPESVVSYYLSALALGYVLAYRPGSEPSKVCSPHSGGVRSAWVQGLLVGLALLSSGAAFVGLVLPSYLAAAQANALLRDQRPASGSGVPAGHFPVLQLPRGYTPVELQGAALQHIGTNLSTNNVEIQVRSVSMMRQLVDLNLRQHVPDWKRLALAVVAVQRAPAVDPKLAQQSMEWLDALVDLAPHRPDTIQLQAYILLRAGQRDEALSLLQGYLSRNPAQREQLAPLLNAVAR